MTKGLTRLLRVWYQTLAAAAAAVAPSCRPLFITSSQAAASDMVTPAPYDWIQIMPDKYQILISLLNSSATASEPDT